MLDELWFVVNVSWMWMVRRMGWEWGQGQTSGEWGGMGILEGLKEREGGCWVVYVKLFV